MEKFQDSTIQAKNIFRNYHCSKSLRVASYVLYECLFIQGVLQALPKEDKGNDRWRRIMDNTTNIIAYQRDRIDKLLIESDIKKCPAITNISDGLMHMYSRYLIVYLLETEGSVPLLLRRYLDPIKVRVPLIKIY